ncbi:lipopolysaccharide biosynthesis protein [Halomicrococcus sp. SG-WS-1]|uniref:lipopolysaccharide biosynthesis protein n=1 Tax=Halomicrococcus sp. SG-WS-1 TaxID=3439057 RepID=UPI003F79F4E2
MSNPGNTKLGLEALKGFPGKVLQAILGFAGTIIFARILGPTSFGGFYFLLSLVFIVDRPIRGFGAAIRKRWSEVNAQKAEIAGAILIINTVYFVIVGLFSVLFAKKLREMTNIPEASLVFMALLVAIGFFFPAQKMLLGQGGVAASTWTDTIRSLLTFPFQIALVLGGMGAAGMGYGLAGATLTTIPVTLYVLQPPLGRPTWSTFYSLWDFAKYSIPASFVGKTYERLDVLLLGTFIGTGVVGQYEVAFKLTVPAMFLSDVVLSGLLPKVSHRISSGKDVTDDLNNALGYISIISIPIFFGALAFPETLVLTAYGEKYQEAGLFLIGLALYRVLSSQKGVYVQTLSGLDRPDINLVIGATTLVVNIVLGVALIEVIGGIGVVIATVIAEGFYLVVTVVIVRRFLQEINPIQRPLLIQVFAGVIMYLAIDSLVNVISVQSWMQVGIIVAIGAGIYGSILVASRPHREVAWNILRDAGIH